MIYKEAIIKKQLHTMFNDYFRDRSIFSNLTMYHGLLYRFDVFYDL